MVATAVPHSDKATDEGELARERWNWRDDTFKGYAHASARENQLLATDWGALSPIDVRAIVELISKRVSQPFSLSDGEAMLGILGALTTGRKFEDWLNFVLCPAAGQVSYSDKVFLDRRRRCWEWVLPLKRGALPSKLVPVAPLLIRPDFQVRMVCPPLMQQVFLKCWTFRFGSPDPREVPTALFSLLYLPELERKQRRDALRVLARKILRSRTVGRSSTQSLQSVERWLLRAMAALEGGDPATACRVTGQTNIKLVESQLYYGVTRQDDAARLHNDVLTSVGLIEARRRNRGEGYLGGWRTPTLDTLRSFANRSSARLRSARRGMDPVAVHNAMASHTAAILMLATGMRPSKHAHLRTVERQGLAIAFDKTVHDRRVRLLPLVKVLRTQLTLYRSHLKKLVPLLSFQLKRRLGLDDEHQLSLFILSGLNAISAQGPTACWQAALEDFEPGLHSNLNRHHLRASLVGTASHESIDAFFGHWVIGTEPWGRFSGLDPLEYGADLEHVLSRHLEDAGWKSERGLGGVTSSSVPSRLDFSIGDLEHTEPPHFDTALRAQPSSFNGNVLAPLSAHDPYRPFFEDRLSEMPKTREGRLGQILASAICRGAFLDEKWFEAFLTALPSANMRLERVWLDMEAIRGEDHNHVYGNTRRWFCDPLTELLLRKWRSSASAKDVGGTPLPSAASCLNAYIRTIIADDEAASKLLNVAQLYWQLRMPGVLVSYANGEGPSLSLSTERWSRVASGRPIRCEIMVNSEISPTLKREWWKRPELIKLFLRDIKSKAPVPSLIQHGESLAGDQSLSAHLARWTALALCRRGQSINGYRPWGQKRPYAHNTVYGYFTNLCDFVFKGELSRDVTLIDAGWLDFRYRQALAQDQTVSNRNKTLYAIYSFQAYLRCLSEELDVGDSYEEFNAEARVSVNALSGQDYQRALQQIAGEPGYVRMLRQILTIAFRTGLRLKEILGLRHIDVRDGAMGSGPPLKTEIYLRPHGALRLKTEQSRRMLPLDVLLNERENFQFADWRREYAKEVLKRPTGLLFSSSGGNGKLRERDVRDEIVRALVRATGDKTMRFEHLRHSFATHLMACLLLPRDGTFSAYPAGLDEDCISRAKADRVLARVAGEGRRGRSAVHVVSQLCGHGPVTTTLRWYTHMLDWSLGAYTNRRLLEPRVPIESALAVLPQRPEALKRADQTLRRADRRRRALQAAPFRETSSGGLIPPPLFTQALLPAKGEVHLMSVFASLKRQNAKIDQAFTPATGVQYARRYLAPADQQSIRIIPSWRTIREALLSLRTGTSPQAAARAANVEPRDVKRWLKIADLISGPRREGELRMRFQSKMSRARLDEFDVAKWRREFPASPRGPEKLDMVETIWRLASPRIDDPDVKWALEEFCRHYSVETGSASFQKRKDALRYYRGMAKMGFERSLDVSLLSIAGNRASFTKTPIKKSSRSNASVTETGPRSCEWLRWRLAGTLPRPLQPLQPKGADVWAGKRWPRAVAIWIDPNRVFDGAVAHPAKIDPHARYAIRFALTMLAIAALDEVRTPDRRRGWIPGYGGYF